MLDTELLSIQPNVYYTVEETARLLRVSRQSVMRLLSKRPVGVKIGRQWRILGAALLNWPPVRKRTKQHSWPIGLRSPFPRCARCGTTRRMLCMIPRDLGDGLILRRAAAEGGGVR